MREGLWGCRRRERSNRQRALPTFGFYDSDAQKYHHQFEKVPHRPVQTKLYEVCFGYPQLADHWSEGAKVEEDRTYPQSTERDCVRLQNCRAIHLPVRLPLRAETPNDF